LTVAQAIKQATHSLPNCQRPRYEAELLLSLHLKCDRNYLFLHENEDIVDCCGYFELVKRRAQNEPFEYISKKVSFYDTNLFVKKGVLIPRPETELLIDEIASIIREHNLTRIAEIGVGSGAISIMLARKFPHLQIVATDISSLALEVAAQNIMNFNLDNKISLVHTSLLDGVDDEFELIVSNPPYIAQDTKLEPNVIDYEPKEALFGGESGDEILKQIIDTTKERKIQWLGCEMGFDQKDSMERYLTKCGVKYTKFYDDLANLNRGFIARF